ncbi:PREDICTED: microtubule-associated protein TORTIFOLIA1-like [Nelumbo nucifera]|uniref:Microtubule-associated protein TORTIFOLIA1-like n=1 Tax=Nelumbo nucifera TaxID=4432 RepID=A0A1U8B529_NELNU|nr:PREDICTED: microtubule-associated protein TORTIFOLIA1-like [Nelumbo nucifera]
MSSQASKPSKSSKPPNTSTTSASSPSSITASSASRSSSSLSSHFAMIELKQRILNSLSKLSDRDTHQIAVEELEKIIQTLSPDGVSMLLNCLYDASNDPKPAVKKEALRLLGFLCTSHADSTSTHLTKTIAHIVRRLKDSDSGVRDSCRDAIGVLSSQYLQGSGDCANLGSVVSLFVKPLFEAMNEQNKVVQAGSAMCMARMVECATDPPVAAFQKLCPKICKYLNSQNFLAKAALLPVVASLSQVGALAPQSLPVLLQNINDCLESTDWATRKAAAETLTALASHSGHLVADGTTSIIAALEACRFDKVKPVRDSMTEALQLWKNIAGKAADGGVQDEPKAISHDVKSSETTKLAEKLEPNKTNPSERTEESSAKETSIGSPPSSNSLSKVKGSNISDKAVGILKKKAPALTDKELNPEFFQKLETRGSGDLPVEVVVPRRCLNSANSQDGEESEPNDTDSRGRSNHHGNPESDAVHGSGNFKYQYLERGTIGMSNKQQDFDDVARDKWTEQRVVRGKDLKTRGFDADDRSGINQRDSSGARVGFPRADGYSEGSFINNKGNWLAIQRQLTQLERQQAHLMNMLQDFMGGSHDSMVTLENRVRGLERIVEDMIRDLAVSSGRRGSNFMVGYEGSSMRPLGKYNGLSDYSSKLGRGSDGRIPFADRFLSSDVNISGMRGRDPPWRSDASEAWDSYAYGSSRNGHISSRRALGGDGRSPREEHDSDQISNRRAWDKGQGPVRLGEGPSARSVWQASKDEATLEAIRVAGEDNGISRTATRVAIPELTAEALGDENMGQERGPNWASWNNAMDALYMGDMDSAYAEVLSTGDDLLLVKLMEISGPVVDQLSNEIANEVLHAVGQFLMEQNLFDIGLYWVQQLRDLVMENGPDVLGIPMEVKRELLLSLQEVSSAMDPPEDWEGATPDQLMLQLASAWGIDLQQLK